MASFLSLTCACLAVSGASCPWLSFAGDAVTSAVTIGLFKYCSGGKCEDIKVDLASLSTASQPFISASIVAAMAGAELKVAAAMFYLAFIFLLFSTAAGVAVMAGKGSGKAKLLLSAFSALLLFIGEVIAANWVRARPLPSRPFFPLFPSAAHLRRSPPPSRRRTTFVGINKSMAAAAPATAVPRLKTRALTPPPPQNPAQTLNQTGAQKNNELIALNLAPKWGLEPGFSTGTSAVVIVLFVLLADVALLRAKEPAKNLWGQQEMSHVSTHAQVVNLSHL